MKTKKLWYRLSVFLAAAVLLLPQCVLADERTDAETIFGQCTQRLQACGNDGRISGETNFGNFMTDAMRWYSGAEVALLPSRDIGNHLQIGDVTERELANCLMRDMPLAAAHLTAGQLYGMLENSVAHYMLKEDQTIDWSVSEFDGFLQLSGLHVVYNATAPVGERILTLTTSDGTAVEPEDQEKRFLVVSTKECFDGGYGYLRVTDYRVLGTEREAAAAYAAHLGTVSIPKDSGRITIGGTRSFLTSNSRVVGGMIAVLGLLLVCTSLKFRKRMKE